MQGGSFSLLNLKHLVQPGQFEQILNQSMESLDDYTAAILQSTFMDGDKRPQSRTVDVIDASEINDKSFVSFINMSNQTLTELCCFLHIYAAAQVDQNLIFYNSSFLNRNLSPS